MKGDPKEKTKEVASLYFGGWQGERPFDLWVSFDKELAKELSIFITGQMYGRERIPHKIRQLVTIAALTVLGREDELKLHIHGGLNVGCSPEEISEVIFQMGIYGGFPATNLGLKALREVLEGRGMWPIQKGDQGPS